jgi:hypothetical protein
MHKNGSVGVFDKWRRCQANGQKIQPINNAFAHSQKRNIFGPNESKFKAAINIPVVRVEEY